MPATVKDLHQSIENADAIILATPEYNRSYSPMQPVQQPEFYLAGAADKFDEQGILIDEQTKKLITDLWTNFKGNLQE